MKSIMVGIFFCWCGTSAMAQQAILDGNSLQEQCVFMKEVEAKHAVSAVDYGKAMFCLGYIRAAVDFIAIDSAMKVSRVDKDGELKRPCVPEGVTNSQGIKVVLKYLDDNPAQLNLPATTLILRAMNVAFPCH